jgi:hypothetical protein
MVPLAVFRQDGLRPLPVENERPREIFPKYPLYSTGSQIFFGMKGISLLPVRFAGVRFPDGL